MKHKIGEIFEFKKDWYQCVEGRCKDCHFSEKRYLCKQFIVKNFCLSGIIFKKLEKVGKPYMDGGKMMQKYKRVYREPIYFPYKELNCYNDLHGRICIEIKPTLKEFDLEAAKLGKPVCTRDGRKARIICFDRIDSTGLNLPIVALIQCEETEVLQLYRDDGKRNEKVDLALDLMMLPEKKEGWVNVYRDCDGVNITKDDNIYSSKEAAIESAQIIGGNSYVATTKINWEE